MRNAALVLFVLLAGLIAWWSSTGGSDPAIAPMQAPPVVVASETAAATAQKAKAPADLVGPERTQAEASSVASSPAAGLTEVTVRVLDLVTREPIPGAEVLWDDHSIDPSKLSDEDRARWRSSQEDYLRSIGRVAISDSVGRVVLHLRDFGSLTGRSGALYGTASWHLKRLPRSESPYAGEVLLMLQVDRTLHVRVVDELHVPVANAFAGLETVYRMSVGAETTSSFRKLPLTGSDGLTALVHAQEAFIAGKTEGATLRVLLSGGDGEPVPVDLAAIPDGPVEVVAPAFGSVLVELLGADAMPWAFAETDRPDLWMLPVGETARFYEDGIGRQQVQANGQALFTNVRCGCQFNVRVAAGWGRMEVAGPTRLREQVRVAFKLGVDAAILVGRVLDGDGAPYLGPVTLSITSKGGMTNSGLVRDAMGRFRIPLPSGHRIDPKPSIVLRATRQEETFEAAVPLRALLIAGDNNLGDLVLAEPPLLVSGQLVFVGSGEASSVMGTVWLALEQCAPGEPDAWTQSMGLSVTVDAERRFVARGDAGGMRYRLCPRGLCAPREPIEFEPGSKDVRVEVTMGATVKATFLVEAPNEHLSYLLVPEHPEGAAESNIDGWPQQVGERVIVSWNCLAAGPHRLLVSCDERTPLVDMIVDVPAGGPATDPRLVDMDLRGRTRRFRVMVTDEGGQSLKDKATIVLRGPLEAGGTWMGRAFSDGSKGGELLRVSKPVDLYVFAAGYRTVALSGVFADTTVAMQAAPMVTFSCPEARDLPEGIWASLGWQPEGWPVGDIHLDVRKRNDRNGGWAKQLLGPGESSIALKDGVATLAWPGAFAVRMDLRLRRSGQPLQTLALRHAPVDPAQLADGQVVELHADAASVQAAVQKLTAK